MAWIKTYINLNILECKWKYGKWGKCSFMDINLNILECKFL